MSRRSAGWPWVLLGLILGERLMGVPGMILAPVVLNYLRLEGSKIEVTETSARQG